MALELMAAGRRRWTLPALLALLALSAAVVLPFRPPFPVAPTGGALEATVSTDAHGIIHLYYDIGHGFNEADSRFAGLEADGRSRRIRLPLPPGTYTALRLDPLNRAGTATLADVRVVDGTGRTLRAFGPGDFRPIHQIARLAVEGGRLRVVGEPGASYLSLAVALDHPLVIKAVAAWHWLGYLSAVLGCAAVAGLAVAAWPPDLGRAVAAGARRRPRAALAAVAVAGVLASCFPVVFAGRSFVAPNNGVLLLYETLPTLPGYAASAGRDQRGSDVGAVMWWHLPASGVERRALLHDHELPLWDRYDLCGEPLLGQGQSMLGDPLHWATVLLGGGGALAWDLKYLLAKALFAWGLGLVVLELAGGLGFAAGLTVACQYLGFFAFRENHPAFFSLCYSPWILLAWLRLAAAAPGRWWPAAALLAVADLAEINSGTVKEAYMLALGLNAAGLLVVLLDREPRDRRGRRLAVAAWGSLLAVLVAAPDWLVFLDTLRVSMTSYEHPRAQQLPLARLIGLFDDLFYRQASPGEVQVDPSANALVLLGVLWAAVAGRGRPGARKALALALAAAPPLALVFGLVPAAAIIRVPFLRNIIHVDNTFSCLLIALLLPLAGWGWRQAWEAARDGSWGRRGLGVAGGVLLLVAAYFTVRPPEHFSAFFRAYAVGLGLGAALVHAAARRLAVRPSLAAGLWLLLGCGALLWRHGQYLDSPYDGYVFSPQGRVRLDAPSPALEYAAAHAPEPARTIGLGLSLFPGYNQLPGIESIFGVEALRSRPFVELAGALGLNRVEHFTDRDPDDAALALRPAYDALNVEYFLRDLQALSAPLLNWDPVADLDLAVLRSRTFWPRAFFVPRLQTYSDLPHLAGLVQGAAGPFAAVEDGDHDISPDAQALIGPPGPAAAVPATDYALTSNRTGFAIRAPGPGVAVLLESWFPEDFRATVNGQEVPYFRVNHAFKGVYLSAAGIYRVEFSYWPRHLSLALALAGLGLVLAAGTVPAARRLGW